MADHTYKKHLESVMAYAEDQSVLAENKARRTKGAESNNALGRQDAFNEIAAMITTMLARNPKQDKIPWSDCVNFFDGRGDRIVEIPVTDPTSKLPVP